MGISLSPVVDVGVFGGEQVEWDVLGWLSPGVRRGVWGWCWSDDDLVREDGSGHIFARSEVWMVAEQWVER